MDFIKFNDKDINFIENNVPELTLQYIKENYSDLFNGLGCFEHEYDIKIDENEVPKVHAPRKIPHSLKNKLR